MSKKTTRIICLILAVLMVLGVFIAAIPALAVTQEEIDKLQEERDEIKSQQDDIKEQIDALQTERTSAMERKAALDQQIALKRQDIELIDAQIAIYDEMIEEKGEELEEARAAEQAQFDRYLARVRTMEETNGWDYISILLQATSLTDFLSRLNDVIDIVRNDQNVKEEYIAARELVEEVMADYQDIQDRQLQKKDELQAEEASLEEQIEQASALVLMLEDDIDAYESVLDAKAAEQADIQARIDAKVAELQAQEEEERRAREAYEAAQRALQEQAARQAAQQAAQQAQQQQQQQQQQTQQQQQQTQQQQQQTTVAADAGYYIWPVGNTYITSMHGYRVHPIFGTTKYHAGVDIAAGYDAPVSAAAGGTVQISEYSDSYGNYCVIYHSNGTTTLYAHMNSLPVVSVGDTVSAGQLIGYVGSTGWATGPHLHFEIRVNGTTVDPLSYFPNIAFTISPDA